MIYQGEERCGFYIGVLSTSPEFSHDRHRFGDVLAAVEAAPGLTPGVRSNLRGVVLRTARELSGAGLDAAVDVPRLNRWTLRATAARLGFRSRG